MSNTLDSRDLQQELDELLEQFENWKSNLTDEQIHKLAESYDCEVIDLTDEDFRYEWDVSDAERIDAIQNLKNEEIYEWESGVIFVKDSYFEEYAEELAKDLGIISSKFQDWPYNCINWQQAADQLQQDYSSVEFDGETYWYRNV